LTSRTEADRLRREAPDPDRQGQARRGARSRSTPTCCTPRPRARCWKTRPVEPPPYVYQRTISPEDAPDKADLCRDRLRSAATPSPSTAKALSPATLLTAQRAGRANGIGRLDLVENRFVGMKSRGVYETPGGTILLAAHRGIEAITLDRGAAHLKDELMPRYAELIYNGFWFAPEREMLQALIDKSQERRPARCG
jgi:argininosuccinate synthase